MVTLTRSYERSTKRSRFGDVDHGVVITLVAWRPPQIMTKWSSTWRAPIIMQSPFTKRCLTGSIYSTEKKKFFELLHYIESFWMYQILKNIFENSYFFFLIFLMKSVHEKIVFVMLFFYGSANKGLMLNKFMCDVLSNKM